MHREYGRLKILSGRSFQEIKESLKPVLWNSFELIRKTITYVRKINLENNTRYVNEVRF